jgi:hypothetical protein
MSKMADCSKSEVNSTVVDSCKMVPRTWEENSLLPGNSLVPHRSEANTMARNKSEVNKMADSLEDCSNLARTNSLVANTLAHNKLVDCRNTVVDSHSYRHHPWDLTQLGGPETQRGRRTHLGEVSNSISVGTP